MRLLPLLAVLGAAGRARRTARRGSGFSRPSPALIARRSVLRVRRPPAERRAEAEEATEAALTEAAGLEAAEAAAEAAEAAEAEAAEAVEAAEAAEAEAEAVEAAEAAEAEAEAEAGGGRRAGVGAGWREVFLEEAKAASCAGVVRAVLAGHSVLVQEA